MLKKGSPTRRRCSLRLLIVAAALATSAMAQESAFAEAGPAQIPKALFVIVDGISADVIESTFTPNLDAIASSEGYTRSTVGGEIGTASESPTISAVGYNSLLTGTWANKHNVYTNSIKTKWVTYCSNYFG